MRSIWNGTITFGLVTVPIKVYSATESKTVRFHEVHAKDGTRIEHRRICSKDGKEVEYEDVVKGYEVSKGRWVELTDDEIAAAAGSKTRRLDIDHFVPDEEIDPDFYERTYYLGAGDKGKPAYALLHAALGRSGRAGVGRWIFHNRERTVVLRPLGDVLAIHTMRFAGMRRTRTARTCSTWSNARRRARTSSLPRRPSPTAPTTCWPPSRPAWRRPDGRPAVVGVARLRTRQRARRPAQRGRRQGPALPAAARQGPCTDRDASLLRRGGRRGPVRRDRQRLRDRRRRARDPDRRRARHGRATQETRTIDIEAFVDLADVDPIHFDHPYVLMPLGESEGTLRAYRLLVEVMARSERAIKPWP